MCKASVRFITAIVRNAGIPRKRMRWRAVAVLTQTQAETVRLGVLMIRRGERTVSLSYSPRISDIFVRSRRVTLDLAVYTWSAEMPKVSATRSTVQPDST